MEAKKDGVRVRMTKQMLRNAFTELMMEKPIRNITVRELCDKAQVNRGTFYVHYADIYELMESIEKQMYEELQHALDTSDIICEDERGLVGPCLQVFEFLEQNSDMCTLLLGKNSDFSFLNRLLDMGKEYSLQKYLAVYAKASKKQAEYFYSFVSSGCIGLLRQWVANDFKDSAKSMAQMAENMMLGATKALKMPMEEARI